jgi:ribonuclease HI
MDDRSNITLFTDGACSGNPGPGGWGFILRDAQGDEVAEYGGVPSTTNNRMEMLAVIEGLRSLAQPRHVDVYSDSKYVVDGLGSWLDNWLANGWKTSQKKPVLNRDLWEALDELRGIHEITTHWVRGHDDHPENERCDRLAVQGRDEAARGGGIHS